MKHFLHILLATISTFMIMGAVGIMLLILWGTVPSLINIVKAQELVIKNHKGGAVLSTKIHILRLRMEQKPLVLSGDCYSACTMYLGYENTCLTPGAKFYFHQAQTSSGNRLLAIPNRAGSATLLEMYPKPLRAWIEMHGGLPWYGWLKLSTQEAVDLGITKYCKGA